MPQIRLITDLKVLQFMVQPNAKKSQVNLRLFCMTNKKYNTPIFILLYLIEPFGNFWIKILTSGFYGFCDT